jgi:hypothetical protein
MNKLKNCDHHGHSLNLLFAGSGSFKTGLGGIIALLVNLVVFVYGGFRILSLAKKNDPTITTTQSHVAANSIPPLNLTENSFDLMFSIF